MGRLEQIPFVNPGPWEPCLADPDHHPGWAIGERHAGQSRFVRVLVVLWV